MKVLSVLAKTNGSGGACDDDDCPTVYLTDDGRLIIQGDPADDVEGIKLGSGEHAVIVPAQLIERLARATQP